MFSNRDNSTILHSLADRCFALGQKMRDEGNALHGIRTLDRSTTVDMVVETIAIKAGVDAIFEQFQEG